MQKLSISFLAIVSLWQSITYADDSHLAASFFTQLYTNTCVKNAADLQVLKSRFSSIEVKQLSRGKAALFLENKPGIVWVIPNVIGDFLVSINEQTECAVYTRHVNINEIERGFIKVLEKTPSSFKIEKVQDETVQTDLGPGHLIRYIRTNTADSSQQEFRLETTNAQGAQIQVKAVVGPVIY